MGKEIVYCDICGARIAGDEFAKGRAVVVESKNYCFGCRKQAPVAAAAPEAPPPKPAAPAGATRILRPDASGSRIPRPPVSSHTPPPGRRPGPARPGVSGRVPRPTAPARSNKTPVLIAAAAGAALLIGLAIAAMMRSDDGSRGGGGSTSGGGGGPAPDPDAALWAALEEFAQRNADDPATVLERFQQDLGRPMTAETREKIKKRIEELEKQAAAKRVDQALAGLIKDIETLDPTVEMLQIHNAYRAAVDHAKENPSAAPRVEQLKATIEKRVRPAIPPYVEQVLAKAEEAMQAKKPVEGINAIDSALLILHSAAPYVAFDEEAKRLKARQEELRKLLP